MFDEFFQEDMGLDEDQVNVLKRCFDGFADEDGAIPAENVGNILSMMGLKVSDPTSQAPTSKGRNLSDCRLLA